MNLVISTDDTQNSQNDGGSSNAPTHPLSTTEAERPLKDTKEFLCADSGTDVFPSLSLHVDFNQQIVSDFKLFSLSQHDLVHSHV